MNRPMRIAITISAVTSVCLLPSVEITANAADEGRLTYNNYCRTCHSVKQGDNRQGPSLHGVFGAKAGQVAGYNYSGSLRGSGLTWDEATLDKWIENPDAVVPNNKMKPYTGIRDPQVRQKIIEFLRQNRAGS